MRKVETTTSDDVKKIQKTYEIIRDVLRELKKAEEKHPNFPSDIFQQLSIMIEESGEVSKAVNDFYFSNAPIEDIKTELKQTAAMCIRMLLKLK